MAMVTHTHTHPTGRFVDRACGTAAMLVCGWPDLTPGEELECGEVQAICGEQAPCIATILPAARLAHRQAHCPGNLWRLVLCCGVLVVLRHDMYNTSSIIKRTRYDDVWEYLACTRDIIQDLKTWSMRRLTSCVCWVRRYRPSTSWRWSPLVGIPSGAP